MIKIICVGRLKEKYLIDACCEYLKRITKYTNIQVIEIQDSSIDNEKIALEKERDTILKNIKEKEFLITLEIDGIQLSSVDFASKLDKFLVSNSNITFVIGGYYGLHPDIKQKANFSLSFSKMTFPHQLFRVLLLEQIFRTYKILNNEKYHK